MEVEVKALFLRNISPAGINKRTLGDAQEPLLLPLPLSFSLHKP